MKQQKPIDHELIFDLSAQSSARKFLEEGPRKFLQEIIPEIKKDYPLVHRAMMDPSTRVKVLARMKATRELGEVEMNYVEGFFKTYKEVNAELTTASTSRPTSSTSSKPRRRGFIDRLFDW